MKDSKGALVVNEKFLLNFSTFTGLRQVAEEKGLGQNIKISVGRMDKNGERFNINTDGQARLEMDLLFKENDRLNGM